MVRMMTSETRSAEWGVPARPGRFFSGAIRLLDRLSGVCSARQRRFRTASRTSDAQTARAHGMHRSRAAARNTAAVQHAGPACVRRVAALCLALLCVLAVPTAALAQAVTLVSNTGQGDHTDSTYVISGSPAAQQFTTGDNTAGYTLTAVDIVVTAVSLSPTSRVRIFDNNNSNHPKSMVHELTLSGTLANGTVTFNAPANATLDANTKYHVHVAQSGGTGSFSFRRAASGNEDSGAASGWSIAGQGRFRELGDWHATTRHKIAIKGVAVAAPGVPTGLGATANGQNQIDLDWTAPTATGVADISGYRIEVSTDAGTTWSDLVANTGSTGTTYAHTGLSAEDTRHYRISAINSVGTGTASDEASATTDAAATATAPGAPVSFLASLPGDRQVTLSWARPLSDGGAAITKYEYRYKTDGDYGNWRELLTIVDALSFARTVSGLTNGTPHTFQARAVNSVGGGAESNESTATPRTTPGAPQTLEASAGDAEVTLSWLAPSSDGGAAITSYQYRYKTTGNYSGWSTVSGGGATRNVTVLSLTNDTPHTFEVRARNSAGGGTASEVIATPAAVVTAPGPPTNVQAVPGVTSGSVKLSWSPPASDGGADIDRYQYRYKTTGNYNSWRGNYSGSSRSRVVSGLTNGTVHTFQMRAHNSAGNSTETAGITATPRDKPGAPPSLVATGGDGEVTLDWGAAAPNGDAVTLYEYRYKTTGTYGNWSTVNGGCSARSVTVSSLTNGMLHTFEVRAVNNAGDGTASEATATPTAANAEPVFTDGASTTRSVDENTASGQNVGSPVSATDADSDTLDYSLGGTDMASFAIVSTSGQIRTSAALDRESKSSYSLTVSVSDGNGGTASIAVTVNVGDVNEQPARPAAPSVGATSGSNTSLDVSWTAPGRNGGPAISGYNLQYREGTSGGWTNGPQNVSGTSRAIPGLVQGTAYQVQIQALNGETPSDWSLAGSGSTSSPGNTAPGPPTNVQAAPGVTSGSVRLSWSPPASDGGADIDRYQYRYKTTGNYPANWTTVNGGSSARSVTVSSLDNDTPHTFQVRAVNSAGDGTASEVIATPTGAATTTVPGALGSLNASAGDGRVTLRWSAPSSDGGAAITRYEYRYKTTGNYPVNWTTVPGSNATTTSYTVPSLTNGTLHTFQVRAVNSVGAGTASSEATATPTTTEDREDEPTTSVPGAPRNLSAVGGDGQVVLTWDAPSSDGGAKITDYEYRIDGRGRWISIGSTLTTHTVTGLVNGREYTFQVRAVNRRGKGRVSSQAEAKPEVFILDFAHFANGDGITSDLVFVNVASHPIRPALYFYDTEGQPMAAESVLDITGDLEIQEDGSLSIQTEMEPLAELTISTHGQGELVSGSVKVDADGPIGGGLRFDLPGIGVAGVGASPPVRDAVFPVRRQEGGINTGWRSTTWNRARKSCGAN